MQHPTRPLTPVGHLALGDLGVVWNSKEVEAKAPSRPGLTSPRDGESTVGLAPLALSLWRVGGVLSLSPRAARRTCPEEAQAEETLSASRGERGAVLGGQQRRRPWRVKTCLWQSGHPHWTHTGSQPASEPSRSGGGVRSSACCRGRLWMSVSVFEQFLHLEPQNVALFE